MLGPKKTEGIGQCHIKSIQTASTYWCRGRTTKALITMASWTLATGSGIHTWMAGIQSLSIRRHLRSDSTGFKIQVSGAYWVGSQTRNMPFRE